MLQAAGARSAFPFVIPGKAGAKLRHADPGIDALTSAKECRWAEFCTVATLGSRGMDPWVKPKDDDVREIRSSAKCSCGLCSRMADPIATDHRPPPGTAKTENIKMLQKVQSMHWKSQAA